MATRTGLLDDYASRNDLLCGWHGSGRNEATPLSLSLGPMKQTKTFSATPWHRLVPLGIYFQRVCACFKFDRCVLLVGETLCLSE